MIMTGASGLLGKEILKLDSGIVAPSHKELDICDALAVSRYIVQYPYPTVLHLAAHNNPPSHNIDPDLGIRTNIIGTANLARACFERARLVYVSTDYVYTGPGYHTEDEAIYPASTYAWSKLGGECSVQMLTDFLIIRCSFGSRPFPHPAVYDIQLNSKMYVDAIAPLILEAAQSKATGVMNIGSSGQSLYSYARETREHIDKIPKPSWVPQDTRLDTTIARSILDLQMD